MSSFEFPGWLPMHMRYTADPVRRLESLVAEMQNFTAPELHKTRELRAWKIQHLCRQIDPAACAGALPFALCDAQLKEIFCAATAALKRLRTGEKPPLALISAIHVSATLCRPPVARTRRARASASSHP